VRVGERRPVSTLQRMLLLIDRYRSGSGVMNVPAIRRLRGRLDVSALADAIFDVESRHDGLRVRVVRSGLRWAQEIGEPCRRSVVVTDVRSAADSAAALDEYVRAAVREEINVAEGPPYTVHLVRSGDEDHTLILNVHHLVTDAWSNGLIVRDLLTTYARRCGGRDADPLPPVEWQYFDFLDWQEERITGPAAAPHIEFWRRMLGDAPRVALRPAENGIGRLSPPSAHVWFDVHPAFATEIEEFAGRHKTTPFSVYLTAFNAVLHGRIGHDDVTLGVIFANRSRPEVAETVGFFATMVPLRCRLEHDASFATWLRSTRKAVLEALDHQEFPHLALPPRTLPRHGDRLDSVVFHMLPAPAHLSTGASERAAGLDCTSLRMPEGSGSRFDMELMIIPRPDGGVDGVFRYAADIFARQEVQSMADEVVGWLRRALDDQDAAFDDR